MTDDTSSPPVRWGLVADDLTGAADAAVQFTGAGGDARIVLGDAAVTNLGGCRMVAISTAARALPPEVAAERTAVAVRRLMAAGVTRLFVKIDSAIRGSVEAQIDGALRAWTEAHPGAFSIVCPAFPEMGRTVVGAVVLDGELPVDLGPSGCDPVTPVRQADLRRLLVGSAAWSPERPVQPQAGQKLVADAATEDDLNTVGAAIVDYGAAAVAVGSGGLARALAHTPGTAAQPGPPLPAPVSRRIIVAVTSLHPAARAQLTRLQDPGTDIRLIQTPDATVDDAAAAVAEVAEQARALVRRGWADTIVAMGGDGAGAILGALGAVGLTLTGELVPGVPDGVILGGEADGLRWISKSGGFGPPDQLRRVLAEIQSPPPNTPLRESEPT